MSLYTQRILADSPLAYWRLGERRGATSAVDATGNGRTGTYTGTGTLDVSGAIVGESDGAYLSNGTSGFISVADNAALDLATSWTAEAWVYPTSFAGWNTILNKGDLTDRNYALDIEQTTGKLRAVLKQGVNYRVATSTAALALNTWSYVAGVYTGTSLYTLINGVENGTPLAITGNADVNAIILGIGRQGNSNQDYMIGPVDEVAVYGPALATAKLLAHFNAGRLGLTAFRRPFPRLCA